MRTLGLTAYLLILATYLVPPHSRSLVSNYRCSPPISHGPGPIYCFACTNHACCLCLSNCWPMYSQTTFLLCILMFAAYVSIHRPYCLSVSGSLPNVISGLLSDLVSGSLPMYSPCSLPYVILMLAAYVFSPHCLCILRLTAYYSPAHCPMSFSGSLPIIFSSLPMYSSAHWLMYSQAPAYVFSGSLLCILGSHCLCILDSLPMFLRLTAMILMLTAHVFSCSLHLISGSCLLFLTHCLCIPQLHCYVFLDSLPIDF